MFFLLNGVFISDFCSAFRLIVKQIPSAIFSPWGKIIFIVINHTEFAFVNHFLIAFHIRCSACVLHVFRGVCTIVIFKQTFFIAVGDVLVM